MVHRYLQGTPVYIRCHSELCPSIPLKTCPSWWVAVFPYPGQLVSWYMTAMIRTKCATWTEGCPMVGTRFSILSRSTAAGGENLVGHTWSLETTKSSIDDITCRGSLLYGHTSTSSSSLPLWIKAVVRINKHHPVSNEYNTIGNAPCRTPNRWYTSMSSPLELFKRARKRSGELFCLSR